jgi:two-component system, sporulation sensor kinase E
VQPDNKRIQKKSSRVSIQKTVNSVIVHDMKNLAFRLSALMQNLDENYENPLFKQSMTDLLGDTIRKMNAMVKHFRDQQEHVVVKLRIDLNHILRELIDALPARKIHNLNIDATYAELPLMWGDQFYLHNAFHSMIENAIDAMPQGGTLRVRTAVIQQKHKKKIRVEITDTGIGMTESFLQTKLFQPFVSTKAEGLGLGLFTCRQIFVMHHGRMEVTSAPGEGTTFRILFPVNEDKA